MGSLSTNGGGGAEPLSLTQSAAFLPTSMPSSLLSRYVCRKISQPRTNSFLPLCTLWGIHSVTIIFFVFSQKLRLLYQANTVVDNVMNTLRNIVNEFIPHTVYSVLQYFCDKRVLFIHNYAELLALSYPFSANVIHGNLRSMRVYGNFMAFHPRCFNERRLTRTRRKFMMESKSSVGASRNGFPREIDFIDTVE